MLNFTEITLKSADLGDESLIPDIHDASANPFFFCDESVCEDWKVNVGLGMIKTRLPYKDQNMYSRTFANKNYKAAVLENEHIKAVFLPELGGRLWSLYDKDNKRDIVYENDALIFANLGFSNVWFAGGVEWNVGVRGHSVFGCRTLFTRKLKGKNGNDILQMYEYEEKRGVVYCINATLDGNVLLVHPEIHNVAGSDICMYWWSNIAVPQTDKTRTFVPTRYSYITSYREGGYNISRKEIPYVDGKDMSACGLAEEAIDYFYDIPDTNKKWICSLEEDGKGLLHCSSDRLIGRKNFLWGNNAGGTHWNQWLTEGRDYYEIQAGLIKTQFESFVMKKDEVIKWIEAYVGIDMGTNEGEFNAVSASIEEKFYDADAKAYLFEVSEYEPLWLTGSGKGYLASLYRGKKLVENFDFPEESVDARTAYYLDLYNGKTDNIKIETDFTVNADILAVLEKKENRNWFEDYLLALGVFEKEDYDKAYKLLFGSVNKNAHYLPLTALALYEDSINHDRTKAFEYVNQAIYQRPDYYPLVCTYAEISIRAGKYNEFIEFYESSCDVIKNTGRVQMYAGQCYCLTGNLEESAKYINENLVVPDVREGEYAVSNVWVMLKKRIMAKESGKNIDDISDFDVLDEYPIPYSIDFRMHPQKRGV